MKPTTYAVYTVLEDGNPTTVLVTSSPAEAVAKLHAEQALHASRRDHAHGIYDVDEPEDGDLDLELCPECEGPTETLGDWCNECLTTCANGCGRAIEKAGSLCQSCIDWEKGTRKFEEEYQERGIKQDREDW